MINRIKLWMVIGDLCQSLISECCCSTKIVCREKSLDKEFYGSAKTDPIEML